MASWRPEEVTYLRNLEVSCVELSQEYHSIYFKLKTTQNKFKIPSIIIGSFTGVASFGSSTFPPGYQKWISVSVGLINVAIAILTTLESFFKLGEDMNASRSSSEQLKKLAEDINREMSLEVSTRQTSGIIFLRDAYTRYHQILSTAPVLQDYYISHVVIAKKPETFAQKLIKALSDRSKTSGNTSRKISNDVESGRQNQNISFKKGLNTTPSPSTDINAQNNKDYSLHEINNHLILMGSNQSSANEISSNVDEPSTSDNYVSTTSNPKPRDAYEQKMDETPQSVTPTSSSADKLNKLKKQLSRIIN